MTADSREIAGTQGFVSTSIELPSLVPPKVKDKIWAGDFVDLRTLLPGKQQESFLLHVSEGEGNLLYKESHLFVANCKECSEPLRRNSLAPEARAHRRVGTPHGDRADFCRAEGKVAVLRRAVPPHRSQAGG